MPLIVFSRAGPTLGTTTVWAATVIAGRIVTEALFGDQGAGQIRVVGVDARVQHGNRYAVTGQTQALCRGGSDDRGALGKGHVGHSIDVD